MCSRSAEGETTEKSSSPTWKICQSHSPATICLSSCLSVRRESLPGSADRIALLRAFRSDPTGPRASLAPVAASLAVGLAGGGYLVRAGVTAASSHKADASHGRWLRRERRRAPSGVAVEARPTAAWRGQARPGGNRARPGAGRARVREATTWRCGPRLGAGTRPWVWHGRGRAAGALGTVRPGAGRRPGGGARCRRLLYTCGAVSRGVASKSKSTSPLHSWRRTPSGPCAGDGVSNGEDKASGDDIGGPTA
ncbi:hypothetical protein D1007_26120 [Hordeum vulgare]|uniref:Predicted protein n=1 Tax=Hordeum vulgare subsp. vulgare TaxID=112509 RepID=F2D6J2_HORVV|nr:uncharacterized protein LOC123448663 [Hordeum vulgare subsp. vulgare]KAE8798632.1 hypothetical protein D1007_26120 [Hordeum vulgare]KAI4998998.1 hypothetical protein ZWY2020_057458 [Hordeum vulgare]BAJ90713.1 predicted protein [Hordeum vulgare subsp. vulgare]